MSEAAEAPAEEPAAKSGLVKVAALVGLLMTVEAGVLFFLLSGSSAAADEAGQEATAAIADGHAEVAAGSDLVEVELEPGFSVTNSTADLGTLVHVNFDLVCAVAGPNQAAFSTAVNDAYKNRLRQVITEIVRSASLEELQDPDLNQLKRRIREDLNKTLQHSFVVEVIVPKIQVHVQ